MITNLNLPAPALSYDRENEAQMRRELIRWSGSFPGAITNLTLAFPAQFTVQGSPLIGPGTITVSWVTEAANLVLAGPASGAAAAPAFRNLVAADLPLATVSAFGAVKPDGTTVTISAGVISAVGGATGANPTATAGPAAVNGSAATFMRSDAAPAIQKASVSQFGIVEVDGTTITATAGVISSAVGAGLWQLLEFSTSAFTHSFAASGNIHTPNQGIVVYSVGFEITSVAGATYKVGVAPFNTTTNQMTAAPIYAAAVTRAAGFAHDFISGNLGAGLAVSANQPFIIFIVRTDAGTTPSTTLNTTTAFQSFPGIPQSTTATNQSMHLASVAPGTSDTWTAELGYYSVMISYAVA